MAAQESSSQGVQHLHAGGVPTGLSVDVRLPQGPTVESNPEGRGEADVRDTTVAFPAGVTLNPSAANGLEACPEKAAAGGSDEGVGFEGFRKFIEPGGTSVLEPAAEAQVFSSSFRFVEEGGVAPSCPPGSKIGTVHIKTPLLPRELEGAVYLAEPAPNGEAGKNPFNSLIALYLVAQDKEAGVLVKLAGKGTLNEATGQITTTFQDTPQLPFEELRVELFSGQRAPLSTPAMLRGVLDAGGIRAVVRAGGLEPDRSLIRRGRIRHQRTLHEQRSAGVLARL